MDDTGLSHLAGVLLPPPPPWYSGTISVMMILAGLFLVLACTRVWLRSGKSLFQQTPSTETQHRLEAIQRAWQQGNIDERETAYRLATLLRLSFGLAQLHPECPPGEMDDPKAWRTTLHDLAQLRYPRRPVPVPMSTLFRTMQAWLHLARR